MLQRQGFMKLKTGLKLILLAVPAILFLLFVSGCSKDGENRQNHLPKATYTFTPNRGDVNSVILFNADSVSDYEDPTSALEVRWDWTNDKTFDTEYSTIKTATHQFDAVGIYFPLLEVIDKEGMTDTIKRMVVIVSDLSNQPPDMPLYVTPPDWQTWMDREVVFKWTCTDPENDPLVFDIWVGQSRTALNIAKSGINTFNLENGVEVYETTLSGFRFDKDYFWMIGAKDVVGNYTVGSIYKFTTRPAE